MLSVRKQAATWIRLAQGLGARGSGANIHSACRVECWPSYDAQQEGSLQIIHCKVEAESTSSFSLFRNTATSTDASRSSWRQDRSPPSFGGLSVRRFSSESVQWESSELSTIIETEVKESAESGSLPANVAAPPSQVQTSQSTLDLIDLIASKERELNILKAALRDKEACESLLQKHNIKLDPSDGSQQESRWKTPEPLSKSSTAPVDSPTMFGKLSLADFPTQQDSHYERLQRRRRRNEMLQQNLRNSEVSSLNFGASAIEKKENTTGSNLEGESSPPSSKSEPYLPNANAFNDDKPYKSLADRLYEEQFGHPAPPNLERTYPPGSFYDRCMKEKKRKEREAAAAAVAVAASQPPPLEKDLESVDTESLIEASVHEDMPKANLREPRSDEIRGKSTSEEFRSRSTSSIRSPRSNSVNQDMKPGDWRCPECSFHNFSKNVHCYKCQTERPDNSAREKRAPAGRW